MVGVGGLMVAIWSIEDIILYLLLMQLFFDAKLCKNKKRVYIAFLIMGAGIFSFLFGIGRLIWDENEFDKDVWAWLVVLLGTIVVPTFLLESRKVKWYIGYFTMSFVASFLIAILLIVETVTSKETVESIMDSRTNVQSIVLDSACIVIVSGLLLLKKKKASALVNRECSGKQIVYSLLVVIGGVLAAGSTEVIVNDYPMLDPNFVRLLSTLENAIYLLTFMFFVVLSSLAKETNRNADLLVKQILAENLLEEQEKRVELLMMKDQEIRKFRHDYVGQLRALKSYAEAGDAEKVVEYIEKLDEKLQNGKVKVYTGLVAVDSVIHGIDTEMLSNGVELEWQGTISRDDTGMVFDLCIIFMNLLQNAYEAVKELPEAQRKVWAMVYDYNNKMTIEVKNEYQHELRYDYEQHLISTKEQSQNHGIGVRNIQEVVQKHGGDMKIQTEGNIFSVFICI